MGVALCLLAGTAAGQTTGRGFTAVAGEDWRAYGDDAALMAKHLFSWGASGRAGPIDDFVDLVADRTFGRVVRITQVQDPANGFSPQMLQDLSTPLDKAWLRFRIRFSPGWSAQGSGGASRGSAYKVMHLYMVGGGSTGRTKIEIENATHLDAGFGFPHRSYTETALPGNTWGRGGSGQMTTETSDGEWYEFIVYHEKTGPNTGRVRFWRRRLTAGGAIVANPFQFVGWSYSGRTAGDVFPQVRSLKLGINKNRSNDRTQYIFWGPWEIVDGSAFPNPFGVGP